MVHKQLVRIGLGVNGPLTKAIILIDRSEVREKSLPKLGYQLLKREIFVTVRLTHIAISLQHICIPGHSVTLGIARCNEHP